MEESHLMNTREGDKTNRSVAEVDVKLEDSENVDCRRKRCRFLSVSVMCVLLLSIVTTLPLPVQSRITINSNGGYENIVVSISKDVPPIVCPQLIQNIQTIFKAASDYLFLATEKKVFFRRVNIIVPPTWGNRGCGRHGQFASTSRSSIKDASFRIGGEHAIFGHNPWTQQSRGCGLQGDFISMGYDYILHWNETENDIGFNGFNERQSSPTYQSTSTTTITERRIVHEWAKYRYGVFEEIGFPKDPLYPGSYMEGSERKATTCTNAPVRGTWSIGCDESLGSEKNSTCHFIPSGSLENDGVITSIMSFPELASVKHFCNNRTHNAEAPTKQNFVCEKKATYDVIMNHADFRDLNRDGTMGGGAPETEFVVKQITQPKFVLVVEKTGNMNVRDVWKFLKLAVRKFIKYDLPMGSEIGLITVSTNNVRILANMTSLHSSNIRRALADKLPNYPNGQGGGTIALHRSISTAVTMMKQNGESAAGSVIILVSPGMVTNNELESSLELLHEEDVTLASIEYPSAGDGKIVSLSNGTNGLHFVIREAGVGTNTHMSTFVQLINAFMSIQKFFTEDIASSWPTLIHQQEYKGHSREFVESTFGYDASGAQPPAEFFIFTTNPNDPKIDSVELTSPSQIKYTTQLSDLHDINVIKIDAQINETGVWRYRIERLGDSHQSHFVQVVTNSSSEDLHVRLYTNVEEDKIANLTATPLILYVEVKRNDSPVIDADVEAFIVNGKDKWTVTLLDNGNGDADLTRGDGVYSRYFIVPSGVTGTQLEISARIVFNPHRAQYSVLGGGRDDSLSSMSKRGGVGGKFGEIRCCGSWIGPENPREQYKRLHFTERTSNTVVLKISDIPAVDFYPPSRIGDLTLGFLDRNNKKLQLEWTAPGDDFDAGVVSSYQVYFLSEKTSGKALVNYKDVGFCNSTRSLCYEFVADLEAGVRDNVTIALPGYSTYTVFMRAVDPFGKAGKFSNTLKVKLSPVPKETESAPNAPRSGHILSSTGSTMAPSLTDDLTRKELLIVVICGVAFVLLLGILIVSLLFCRKVGSQGRKGNKKNPGDTKISAISDSKSPIHWSASELLGEHEKTARHSLYGGSVSPNGSDPSKGHPNGGIGSTPSPPPDLSMMGNGEYAPASGRSRSSPDSYDDPESPTPIPVSVRNRADYAICVDRGEGSIQGGHHHHMHHPGDPRYSADYGHHSQYENYAHPNAYLQAGGHFSGYGNVANVVHPPNGRFSTVMNNSSNSSSNSPLPPSSYHPSHLIHYDPDIQGSMSSVNSKKRNITMV